MKKYPSKPKYTGKISRDLCELYRHILCERCLVRSIRYEDRSRIFRPNRYVVTICTTNDPGHVWIWDINLDEQ